MSREQELTKDIIQNSKKHPDVSRRRLYSELKKEMEDGGAVKDSIISIFKTRKNIDPRHFSNLIAHAFEYFFFSGILEFDKEYHQFTGRDWKRAIEEIASDRKNKKIFRELLETKVTQTNKYPRYLAPKILISLFFGEQPVDIVDEGASLNLGILGLKAGKKFAEVVDNTEGEFVNENRNAKINIDKGYGIDIFTPEDSVDWILVCNYYPGEAKDAKKFKEEFSRLKTAAAGVDFVSGDISDLENIWAENAFVKPTVVVASTVLYQLKDSKRSEVFENTKNILKDGGIFIINDFLEIEDGNLDWDRIWFDNSPSFATVLYVKNNGGLDGPYEFLRWNNARCSEVFEGKDFAKVIELSGH